MATTQSKYSIAPSVDADRLAQLCAPASFETIVTGLVASAARKGGLQYLEPERSKKMPGCWRPVFRLTTEIVTGDQFFSSPVGYRANYALSTDEGEKCNRLLINALMPPLLKCATGSRGSEVEASLKSEWAKVWIWQKKGQFHKQFAETEPEILVPRWLANRVEAIEFGLERLGNLHRCDRPLVAKAVWGARLHGPVRVLEVIGAWIDPRGEAVPPPTEKLRRSLDIYEFGYA